MPKYFDRQKAKRENPNLTDDEINKFMQDNGLQDSPATAPSASTEPVKPGFFSQPEAPKPQPTTQENVDSFQKNRGFVDKIADFFLPRSAKTVRKVGGTINLKKDLDQAEKTYAEFKKESDKYFEMGKKETDPEKKKKFFDLAKQALDTGSKGFEDAQANYETSTGQTFEDKQLNPFVEGFGMAGEIGTYLLPQEKIKEGATMVQRILAGAKMGGKAGLIMGATAPEELSVQDRVKEAMKQGGTGLATGALFSTLYEVPKEAVKKVLGGSTGRLARVFKLGNSDRSDLRKFAGVSDFEEEILQRDGKAIAGMDYDQLLTHFDDRKKEAQDVLEEIVKTSDKTLSKSTIIGAIDKKLATLKPEKGFLDIGGLKSSLETIKEKVAALPDDISAEAANSVKKQLQEAGDAAYAANGNKANTASAAYAEIGSNVKNAIEDLFKEGDVNPIKEANKAIQLYSVAKKAIENAGGNEVKKMSNDIGQKFFQMLPSMLTLGAGGAAYAGGAGVGGSLGAAMLAQLMLGGVGAARVKYFTPEVQTKLASSFSGLLKNQGIKSADKVAEKIVQEMIRVATVRNASDSVEEDNGVVSTEVKQNAQTGSQGADNNNNEQAGQTHTDIIPQDTSNEAGDTISIRNRKTGEIKQVKKTELNQYGISGSGDPSGLPSKDDVLSAMAVDLAQTGGKNLGKLSTFLGAIEKVEKSKGGNLSANEKAAVQEAQNGLNLIDTLETSYSELQDKGLAASSGGIGRFFAGAKGAYAAFTQEGTEGAAAAAYNNGKDAFLSKLARATGEKGVLNNQDIERIKKAIPSFSDSPETAARQFAFIREIIQGAIDSKLKNPLGDESTTTSTQFEDGKVPF